MEAQVQRTAESLPLTSLQEGIWLLERVGGQQPLVRSALKISGSLDIRRLQRAIARVMARHELLSSGFRSTGGIVRRFNAPSVAWPLYNLDLSGVGGMDGTQCMNVLGRHLERVRLDLSAPPLAKFLLIRIDAATWVLWVAIHHIICDEHSNAILCREIIDAYIGRAFPRPAGSFTDYQRRTDQPQGTPAAEAEREYWRRLVGNCDVSGPINHLNRRFRSSASAYNFRSTSMTATREDAAHIDQLCRVYRCTPTVLFLGLMQIWLTRCSAGWCPPVCVPMQLREDPDENLLVGLLTNLVVIPCTVCDSDGAPDFFLKLRKNFYEAWSHRHVPFSEVTSMVASQRDLLFHPLSRFLFALETPPAAFEDIEDTGLTVTPLRVDTAIPGADLAFIITRGTTEIVLRVQYNASAVASAWAEAALPQILSLIRALGKNPAVRLASLRLPLGHDGLSRPAKALAERRTVFERFRNSSSRFAQRSAVHHGASSLTFAELSARVDAITGLLLADGIAAGDHVGIVIERGADLIATQLAILRLGAAFVPMSADWSPAALTRIAANVKQVFTDGSAELNFPTGCAVRALGGRQAALPEEFREPQIDPSAIACVLYTSGATGDLEGVAISCRGLDCVIEWAEQYFDAAEGHMVCGCAPSVSAMSVLDLLVPACTGMSSLIVDRLSDAGLSPYWNRVTWINAVPAVMREFLKSALLPTGIKIVSLSDEELDRALVQRIRHEAPEARVLNLYGPMEATLCAIATDLDATERVDPVPIGRPVEFHEVCIVDSALNALPAWTVGEIAIGGPCVAAGYVDSPGTTAANFVPDPFSERAGARMFLTGDLAVADGEGMIHLIGRRDSQESILGSRIHLGGIEAILRNHSEVADATCFIFNKSTVSAHVAAALVGRSNRVPADAEFRSWLLQACASSHAPREWHWFDTFPIRAGGKVDRAALLAALQRSLRTKRPTAMTADEYAISQVWRRVIDARVEDVDMNFFDAGGNSLHLPRLCVELESIGLIVGVQELFEYPTLRAQARLMGQRRSAENSAASDQLETAESRGALMRGALAQFGPAG
ncbi:MAG: AMP-binding protein [Xanthobacteraceae bacterium]